MIRSGIDIIEIARIQKAVSRHDGFLPRFFTAEECAYFASRGNAAECIAGHFAAKEAFAKFLGSGVRGFALKDISVLHDRCGKPYLTFRGRSVPADLSISHSRTDAVAVVCGEEWRREFAYDFPRYAAMLPARESSANKGDCGKVLILAGSRGMTGAACLSANAALRTGSGLVTVAAPQSVQPVLACKLTEAMTLPLQEEEGEISPAAAETIFSRMGRADVCVFGPGLGTGRGVSAALEEILGQKQPVLIDADGINVLSANIDILKTKSCRVVLTPHPGEMSRLTGKPIAEIQCSRVDTAVRFAAEYGA